MFVRELRVPRNRSTTIARRSNATGERAAETGGYKPRYEQTDQSEAQDRGGEDSFECDHAAEWSHRKVELLKSGQREDRRPRRSARPVRAMTPFGPTSTPGCHESVHCQQRMNPPPTTTVRASPARAPAVVNATAATIATKALTPTP